MTICLVESKVVPHYWAVQDVIDREAVVLIKGTNETLALLPVHRPTPCSYPGEARPGCLREGIRDELNAKTKGLTAKDLRERIKARWRETEKEG